MKIHRKSLGLSQAKFAEKIDTASNYIALIETGKRFPTPQMIERIALALKIDTPDLFSVEKPKSLVLKGIHKQIITELDQILTNLQDEAGE
ncbi:MAG: helix-turn-helix transcriptional regulator [Spirochaetaceae bacterium]|nr:helix-turn-helix transcriptional regulator [Spirochaetaceae bacterium]